MVAKRHQQDSYPLESVSVPCTACRGTGYAPERVTAVCERCGACWTPARIAAWLDGAWGGWWGYAVIGDLLWQVFARLPCGCKVGCLTYRDRLCQHCRGAGTMQSMRLTERYQQRQRWQLEAMRRQNGPVLRNPQVSPMRSNRTPLLAAEERERRTWDVNRHRWFAT